MENIDLLRKISANTAPKTSLSIAVSDNKTRIITTFNPPIQLDANKRYEMALNNLETYYSFPNIDNTRNGFRWSSDNGMTWRDYNLPIGSYDLININEAIQAELKKRGDNKEGITLQANSVTLKVILKLASGYQVDFTNNKSLRLALGFNAKVYTEAYYESENVVDILSVNTILINVDIISGSYLNGSEHPTIYSFFPNVDPGHKIVEKPQNLIYLPVHTKSIYRLTTTLTDQNNKELNLRGERVSIRYHLREI